jgi:hypothetical protein
MDRVILDRTYPWGSVFVVETDDVCAALMRRYSSFPTGGRLLHGRRDVTPRTVEDVDALSTLSGEFTLTVAPGAPAVVALVVSLVVTAVVGYLMRPKLEDPTAERDDLGSATNAPGRLPNRERLRERVPDLYGNIKHTPDLLAPTRVRYEHGERVEYAYLCVCRGDYVFDEGERPLIRDGDTDIEAIDGYSAHVYNSGDRISQTPVAVYGNAIDVENGYYSACWTEARGAEYEDIPMDTTGVQRWGFYHYTWMPNGESVLHLNDPADVAAGGPHIISQRGVEGDDYDIDYDLSKWFDPGGAINISILLYNTNEPADAHTLHPLPVLSGEYTIVKVTADGMWLSIPEEMRSAWEAAPPAGYAEYTCPWVLGGSTPIGPYTVRARSRVEVTLDAPRGLYFAESAATFSKAFRIETYWRERASGAVLYAEETTTLTGSSRQLTGDTVVVENPHPALLDCDVDVRVTCTTVFNPDSPAWDDKAEHRVDLIGVWGCHEETYGALETSPEVTTILTRMRNTAGTRAVSERGLTITGWRKLRYYTGDGSEYHLRGLAATLADMCLDPRVGRLSPAAIPYDLNWVESALAVNDYFASPSDEFTEFNGVFDNANTTFEEMFATVAAACFCAPYRVGHQLFVRPLLPQTIPTLLFNARNKLPGTESRTAVFGTQDNYDCVFGEFADRDDDWVKATITTADGATPYTMPLLGVTHPTVANTHIDREFQKIYWRNFQVSFVATEEATLLLPGDLILVTDGTRTAVLEGDVVDISGSTITLSHQVRLRTDASDTRDFTCFFQTSDGLVVNYDILNPTHSLTDTLTLAAAPPASLVSTDVENFAVATFYIVPTDDNGDTSKFIVDTVAPEGKGTFRVTASNYTDAYYAQDPVP